MIKGCQKRVIQIKSPKSEIFEEAYFILKDTEKDEPAEFDIVREAERLLAESEQQGKRRRFSFGWDEVLFFGAGIFLAAIFFGVLLLFL